MGCLPSPEGLPPGDKEMERKGKRKPENHTGPLNGETAGEEYGS